MNFLPLFLLPSLILAISLPQQAVEPVSFKTADGWTINADYYPPKPTSQVVLLVHGVGSSRREWDTLRSLLWKQGLGTLAIDLRGHGESSLGPQGPASYLAFDTTQQWPLLVEDLRGALTFLKERRIPEEYVGIIGASIGANLATNLAQFSPNISWLVLLSPGLNYRAVPTANIYHRRILCAAAPTDPYAQETTVLLHAKKQCDILEAKSGHGVGMFNDGSFLKKMLYWIKRHRNRYDQ